MKSPIFRAPATPFATHVLRALMDLHKDFRKAADRLFHRPKAPEAPAAAREEEDWEQSLSCLFHEMMNYSCTLRSNAVLLRKSAKSEHILAPLARMERTTEKIEILAREVLELASVTRVTRLSPLDARRLVEGCISEHFPDRMPAFEVLVEADLTGVLGDGPKLERVFLNLFRNAFQAGSRRVRVRLSRVKDSLLILVEDDGHGCDDEAMRNLFQRHFTTKRESGGSGLGLFMVRAIVEAHGGHIRAVNKNDWRQPGETGMIFCLELPLAVSAFPEPAEASAPA